MFESMDYRLIKDHIENIFQLQWNWSWFLAFVIFWVFGFYGGVYTQNENSEILIIFSIKSPLTPLSNIWFLNLSE